MEFFNSHQIVSIRGKTIVYFFFFLISLVTDCGGHRTSEDDIKDLQARDDGILDEGGGSEDDDSGQVTDIF